jgi:acetylornithine deacetylase/succinyl-diaminopimelate desuccinylase-like protein
VDRHEQAVAAALRGLTRERLAERIALLVDVPSPTGAEAPLATVVADHLRAHGLDGHFQPLDGWQANAWGRLAGDGSGASLLLYAPVDTLTTGDGVEDGPWLGDGPLRADARPQAVVSGDRMVGLGAMNPKGHAACCLVAAELIAAAGLPLRGDLIVALGAGGMPTNSVEDGSGRHHTGQGAGASFLIEQGVWADAAVIAKSGWAVSWEEVGLAWFDLIVPGIHTYVGARHRLPYRNAIAAAAELVLDLEQWFQDWAVANRSELCEPQGTVAAIEAGRMRMASVTPASCRFRVDLRLPPAMTPLEARRQVQRVVGDRARVEPVLGIPGSRTEPDHWIIRSSIAAWEAIEKRPHQPLLAQSGATDANILRNRGIPTARVGLPKATDAGGVELDFTAGMNTVDLGAAMTLTEHLVRVSLDTCLRPREETVG